ncbi:hypothetical protein SAMN05421812_11298 [Asanoa hainanensis]|uniref:Uncharacterized protein n=1 Tax=Asanoa hainanensis TaxID=560556 RepID=A0A239P033_9ACTN|nr:hypothetical protein SAMN05421812_11298 [Asanoa hainanensis]
MRCTHAPGRGGGKAVLGLRPDARRGARPGGGGVAAVCAGPKGVVVSSPPPCPAAVAARADGRCGARAGGGQAVADAGPGGLPRAAGSPFGLAFRPRWALGRRRVAVCGSGAPVWPRWERGPRCVAARGPQLASGWRSGRGGDRADVLCGGRVGGGQAVADAVPEVRCLAWPAAVSRAAVQAAVGAGPAVRCGAGPAPVGARPEVRAVGGLRPLTGWQPWARSRRRPPCSSKTAGSPGWVPPPTHRSRTCVGPGGGAVRRLLAPGRSGRLRLACGAGCGCPRPRRCRRTGSSGRC